MKIILNNKIEEFEQQSFSVNELLQIKKFTYKMILVKVNGKIIEEKDYDIVRISEGDNVMVIHFFAGG